jgi:hypothetical protein
MIAENNIHSMQSKTICPICLEEDENNCNYKMITQCNHYFHKSCFYRANRDKDLIFCPYCKTLNNNTLTRENYSFIQINPAILKNIEIIKKFTHMVGIQNYAISGSFSIYFHQLLHLQSPKWIYNDIDIYYYSNININIPEIMVFDNIIVKNQNLKKSNISSYKNRSSISSYIKNLDKLSFYYCLNNDTDSDLVFKKIFSIDLINVYTETPHEIIKFFDLDCCKVSFITLHKEIKMYIDNNFYVDSYKIFHINNVKKTLERVKKYRARGFKCMNLENYSEELLSND